jgi:hypothetical protein
MNSKSTLDDPTGGLGFDRWAKIILLQYHRWRRIPENQAGRDVECVT